MANFTPSFSSLSEYPMVSPAASGGGGGSSSSGTVLDDDFDDACSICLDPFTTQDPSTVTCCKHEYHLQCILEWSQRSKECPICWQLLVLKDPACQELLAAVENERHLRSRRRSTSYATSTYQLNFNENFDAEQDYYSNDSDFDERIMQHLAAVSRAEYLHRRERQRSSEQSPSHFLLCTSPENGPNAHQLHTYVEAQAINEGSSGDNSPTPVMVSQPLPSLVPPVVDVVSSTSINRDSPSKARVLFRQPPPTDVPQLQSETSSLSESIKSKWFAASARYKESISKGTRGIKEKLLARNNSVKELGKGVQREMSAGIAGVARMIERLDLSSKRTGASSPVRAVASDLSKGVQENIIVQALNRKSEEITNYGSLGASSHASHAVPTRLEVQHTCTEK